MTNLLKALYSFTFDTSLSHLNIFITWIPILDTKPEDLQRVLIFDDLDEYIIGYYHEAGGVFIGSVDGARIRKASFWKSLPELPVQSEEMV